MVRHRVAVALAGSHHKRNRSKGAWSLRSAFDDEIKFAITFFGVVARVPI